MTNMHLAYKWLGQQGEEAKTFQPCTNFSWAHGHPIIASNFCAYLKYEKEDRGVLLYTKSCNQTSCCAICEERRKKTLQIRRL